MLGGNRESTLSSPQSVTLEALLELSLFSTAAQTEQFKKFCPPSPIWTFALHFSSHDLRYPNYTNTPLRLLRPPIWLTL